MERRSQLVLAVKHLVFASPEKAMKEDKENTKPKEKRGEQAGAEDGDKPERVKEKKEVMSKVRRSRPALDRRTLTDNL